MTPPDFRQLICRAQAGHSQALDRLLALTRPLVVRVVTSDPARLPHADESIEDLSQDVCMRVFRKLRSFRGTSPNLGGGSPGEAEAGPQADDEMVWKLYRSWLRKTARRIVLNDRQRHQRRQVLAPHTQLQVDGDGLAPQGGHEPKAPGPTPSSEARRNEMARRVLEAIGKIPDTQDREIIRLRYLEGKSLQEVASLLQLSYDVTRTRHRRSMKGLEDELKDLL
jgi:RNA polymerase sigma factor (sigma-70 family)